MSSQTKAPKAIGTAGIRFESIGGLGAHAAGQILATAAVLRLGMNGAHYSSYGSEKKGSGVKSYIRLTPHAVPIRSSAPIDAPDFLVIFHAALLAQPATLAGLKTGGTVIYTGPPGDVPALLTRVPKGSRIIRVAAQQIANEERSRPNAVLLGTLAHTIDFLDAEAVLETFTGVFEKKHPEAVPSNTRAYRRGIEEFEIIEGVAQGEGDIPTARPSPIWGYDTAPIGGVLPRPGNTVSNNMMTSRTGWLPVFDDKKCIHCGLCDLVCPDYCIVWEAQGNDPIPDSTRMLGVDYQYCKGCQRCVETCPTGALTREVEEPGMADRLRVPLFPALNSPKGASRV